MALNTQLASMGAAVVACLLLSTPVLALDVRQIILGTPPQPVPDPIPWDSLALEEPVHVKVVEAAPDPTHCSCVLYLKSLGYELPRGDAITFKADPAHVPVAGSLVLFNYNGVGHVAAITSIGTQGFWVAEANYDRCEDGERLIKWGDKSIRGFMPGKLVGGKG